MKRLIVALLALGWAGTGVLPAAGETLYQPERQALTGGVQQTLEYNRTNQPSNWINPDTGTAATATPVRTFHNSSGQPCREYVTTIRIGGRDQDGYGTACRQPDGSWQIVTAGAPARGTVGSAAPQSVVVVREAVPVHVYQPYRPYGYYDPWGYRYPYWPYPLSLSLGYFYYDSDNGGGHHKHHGKSWGHHGGYYGKGWGSHGGQHGKSWGGNGWQRGGHDRGWQGGHGGQGGDRGQRGRGGRR